MNIILCIPVLNAAQNANSLLSSIKTQDLNITNIFIIDSESNDGSPSLWVDSKLRLHTIPRQEFNHGATRQLALEFFPDGDIFIFMTQDVILSKPDSLSCLLTAFEDHEVGAVYGRQLPSAKATIFAAHARLFNYPPESLMKSSVNISSLGIKTAFISNSFAAYRRSALENVGGFPCHCIVSEDTYVAAKMILSGWKIAYRADAMVYHSHNYSWCQEFQRYFDIGVFHAREPWIRSRFGGAEGEGRRFIVSELGYLSSRSPHLIISAIIRTMIKYLGFRVGLFEKYLPIIMKKKLSMQKSFWTQQVTCNDVA